MTQEFKEAVDNYAIASFELAKCYELGIGIEPNITKAIKKFQKFRFDAPLF